ncbi:hypothetical protein PENTCL1PPCAC_9274, partial [Pristionchus entomophagus]
LWTGAESSYPYFFFSSPVALISKGLRFETSRRLPLKRLHLTTAFSRADSAVQPACRHCTSCRSAWRDRNRIRAA